MSPRAIHRPPEGPSVPDLPALLRRLGDSGNESDAVSIRIRDRRGKKAFESDLPDEVVPLLRSLLAEFARGRTPALLPFRRDLTSAEAARFLGVSRPHLVSLLDAGRIPSYRVGSHRRVRRDDLVDFQAKIDEARKHALDDLAAHDEDLGMTRG